MSAKTYLRLLQGGLIASLAIIFFVFGTLLFPYITSKQLPFNILMEFLFIICLVFVMRYPEYRPKKNFISLGLILYFSAILTSCFISVDFNLSFWGDAERMLGFFHIAHFLIFYFILITVFRTKKDWQTLLFSSIIIASVVSLIGLFGKNNYSTIGNTAYVSGYLIFNLFFTAILFFRSKTGWRSLYLLPLLIMFWEFKNMHTSGAIIGLGISILGLFLLLGLSHNSKNIRRWSLIAFVLAIIAVVGVFSQYKSAWFQSSFLRNLTFQKTTFQTRLVSWRSAALDFKYHPVFGTGFGNYAIIFDKHFDPVFYNYSKNETYFDRAHNNLIDIVSTTGLVGLITYLSIFMAALYYLWKEFNKNGRRSGGDEAGQRNLEIIIIISLIIAYFIQNLVVFDSFVTYIGLMIMLGFIYFITLGENKEIEDISGLPDKKYFLTIKSAGKEKFLLVILLLFIYIFTSYYNIRPWRMFRGVIQGYSQIVNGNLSEGIKIYQASLIGTPMDVDGRVTIINLVTSSGDGLNSLKPAEGQAILDYVISLAKANLAHNPQDSLMQMQLAQILDVAARFNYKNLTIFNYYSRQAMEAIEGSIESSPRRIPLYLLKAQMQMERGENQEALETVNYAKNLNLDYSDSYCRLTQFYFFLKDEKSAGINLDKCLELGGLDSLSSPSLLKTSLVYYANQKKYAQALVLGERLIMIDNRDPEIWLNLSKLYLASGDKAKAKAAIQNAVILEPSLKTDADKLLKVINSNTIPAFEATTTGK